MPIDKLTSIRPFGSWRRGFLALVIVSASVIFGVANCGDDDDDDTGGATDFDESATALLDLDDAFTRVDPRFLSVAVDSSQVVGGNWWSESGEVEVGVGGTRVAPFDFGRERLRNMARALAPAYLRIGGSEADKLYYDMSDDPVAEPPNEKYEFVFTDNFMAGIDHFAKAVGFDVFFTVNAGAGPRDENKAWTTDNARKLLSHVRRKGYDVAVWELGNEVNGYWLIHGFRYLISGAQFADDIRKLRRLVDELDPGKPVAGPSSAFWPVLGEAPKYVMEDFIREAAGDVDILTWHYYPTQSRRCPIGTRRTDKNSNIDPGVLDEVGVHGRRMNSWRATLAPGTPVWLGETGNAQCGGEPGISDRFVSTFWWMDQLGSLARLAQPVMIRQTLSGSNYGLIRDDDLTPNPDFWLAVLWKRLMSPSVLDARFDGASPGVRLYAHCTPGIDGGVTVLAMNLNRTRTATVALPDLTGQAATTYRVTSSDLYARDVIVNGQSMELPDDGRVPDFPTKTTADAGTLRLPPLSHTFAVYEDAGAAACALGDGK
ncbi:MAG: hypothetical protein H6683_00550 [Deltaproteobacteria bacterium]|nr:hypothetical protein [Deltaproteobacteria bacterium]